MATVLVVDDEPLDREAVRRSLRSLDDVELVFAADGVSALEAVARDAPDVVVTDLRMPRMDGLELVERVSAEHPAVPVILMTSQGSEETAVRALHAGAASYVPKRALDSMLASTVAEVLELAAARRSREAILAHMEACETRFVLESDTRLIASLAAYQQDHLEELGFGDDTLRTQVSMALVEALSNAMIHGNLGIESDLRTDDRERFDALVDERRRTEPWASRRVRLTAREIPERVEYVVEDEGAGFDPSTLPDPTLPENLLSASGRGIMLIRTFMDRVEFNDRGNRLTMSRAATS